MHGVQRRWHEYLPDHQSAGNPYGGTRVFEADTGGKKAVTVVLDVEFRPPQMEVLEQNDRMGMENALQMHR